MWYMFLLLPAFCNAQEVPGIEDGDMANVANDRNASLRHYWQCTCGLVNPELRVAGGNFLSTRKYPFLVTFGVVVSWEPLLWGTNCGGTIITKYHILTAAHCLAYFQRIDQVGVLVGGYDTSRFRKNDIKSVQQVFKHEHYVPYIWLNDVAILVLSEPLIFDQHVMPVCLPLPDSDFTGESVKVVGYGSERDRPKTMTRRPKEMTTVVYPMDDCVRRWGRDLQPNMQICTWSRDETPCFGDSGGPLMWFNQQTGQVAQIGIVSFISNCDYRPTPAVYVKVSAFYPWIFEKVSRSLVCWDV